MVCLYTVVYIFLFFHGRTCFPQGRRDAHGRMDVATQLDLTAVVSPHPELKDVADSEQQGRFNSVQFTCPRNERGFTD